jgi:[ribosomal protein S18]-alanine N-acetyltransferase
MIEVRRLGRDDTALVFAAQHLFDDAARADATRRFLDSADHHLLLAYLDAAPAGFVSGVEVTHPDKGTEMLLYELGVDEPFRRRGIARQLVQALSELAVARGCYGMWVAVDSDNAAALATYRSAGAEQPVPVSVLNWTFATEPGRAGRGRRDRDAPL